MAGPLDRSGADEALGAEGGDGAPKPDGDAVTDPSRGDRGIPRRAFIAGAGALTGAAAVDYLAHAAFLSGSGAVAPKSLLGAPLPIVTAPIAPTITLMVRRREDMLFMRVDGYNLVRKGQKLLRKRPGKATIVFTFVPPVLGVLRPRHERHKEHGPSGARRHPLQRPPGHSERRITWYRSTTGN